MSVYRPAGEKFYRYDFQRHSVRYTGVTDCTRRKDAERVEAELRRQIEKQEHRVNAPTVTWKQAAERYHREVGQYHADPRTTRRDLDRLTERMGAGTLIDRITDTTIADLVSWRRGLAKTTGDLPSPATVNRQVTQLVRKVLIRARDKWKIPLHSMPDWSEHLLDENNERIRELSPDEEARLMECIREDYRPIFRYAKITGARKMNAVGLMKRDLNFEARTITFVQKGGRRHVLPMSDALYWLLLEECDLSPCEHVFTYVAQRTTRTAIRGMRYPITKSGLRRQWEGALRAAGIEDYRWHDNRHTAGTRIAREKGLHTAKRLLGHAKIETTMRYVHATEEDVVSGMEAAETRATELRAKVERDRLKIVKGKQ